MLKSTVTVLAVVGAIGILSALAMLAPLIMAMGGVSLGLLECLLPLVAAVATAMLIRQLKARRIEA